MGQKLEEVNSVNQIEKMGVCIGTCAKANIKQELEPAEKEEIKRNIDPVIQEVSEEDADKENEQRLSSQHSQKGTKEQETTQSKSRWIQSPVDAAEAEQEEKKIKPSALESKGSNHPELHQGLQIKKGTTLFGRGKTEQDNELIQSTRNKQNMKLSKVQLDNGVCYQGEWVDGQREGNGVQEWADGSKYVGEWRNNQANGQGALYHSDGDVYDGEWLNDKANGKGTYTHENGAKYVGDWKDDKQDGFGVEEWPDGEIYEGEYRNGAKNGKGVLKFTDLSSYEGEFCSNEIHGTGVYSWHQNKRYEGKWEHNKMNGYGVTQWLDGRSYEGEYTNDKKHGFGTFMWADGRKYVGNWANGKQHGRGEYYLPNGEYKVGEWVEGKKIKWLEEHQNKQSEIAEESKLKTVKTYGSDKQDDKQVEEKQGEQIQSSKLPPMEKKKTVKHSAVAQVQAVESADKLKRGSAMKNSSSIKAGGTTSGTTAKTNQNRKSGSKVAQQLPKSTIRA